MATAAAKPRTAWDIAKKEVLQDPTLTEDDKRMLKSCTIEAVVKEIEDLDRVHAGRSSRRKVMRAVNPLLHGLEKFAPALDSISQADPNGVFPLVWGGVRILMVIAKDFTKYFEDLVGFLSDIAAPLERLQAYEKLSPNSDRLGKALSDVFIRFLEFTQRTRRMFYEKQNRSRNPFHRVISLDRNVWKSFSRYVAKEIEAIRKECDNALEEAKLAAAQTSSQKQDVAQEKADEGAQKILSTLERQENESKERREANFLRNVETWISPVDVFEDFDYICSQRLPDTCNWVLANETFKSWTLYPIDDKKPNLLWIHAIPGAGKTYLCSRLVEELQAEGRTVAYFFCDTKNNDKRQLVSILRTWTWQLLQQRSDKAKEIEALYNKGLLANKSTFTKTLEVFLGEVEPIHFVLDALDECEEPVQAELLELLHQTFRKAKILVTSRAHLAISRSMKQAGAERVATIKIEEADNKADIRHYLDLKIEAMDLHDHELETQIASDLYEGSRGMFLWVRLMCDELAKEDTAEGVEERLKDLPAGLEAIYGRVFDRIDSFPTDSRKRNARKLLQWIVSAYEPLTLEEIESLMAINYEEDREELNLKKRLLKPEAFIADCCGALVEINRVDRRARLVHASVKDYLLSKSQSRPSATYFIDLREAHIDIARSCLTYLSYDSIQPVQVGPVKSAAFSMLKNHLKRHPVLSYSTLYWWMHVLSSPRDAGLLESLKRFLTCERFAVHWLQFYHYLRGDREEKWHPGDNEYVDIFRFLMKVRDRLRESYKERTWLDIMDRHNKRADYRWHEFLTSCQNLYFPPIAIAALFDFPTIVEEEIRRGVHPDTSNFQMENAIMLGARGDSVASIKVLLSHGANVNWVGMHKEHALHRVISWGGTTNPSYVENFTFNSVPVLLEAGSDVHWRNSDGATLTHYVVHNWIETDQNIESLKLILKYGGMEDVNSKNIRGETPLHNTTYNGLVRMTKILLEKGADPNGALAPGQRLAHTPLHRACEKKDTTIAVMLLKAGADPNILSPSDQRGPLHYTALLGAASFEILLQAGANPNIPDVFGQLPLHYAAANNNARYVALLLKQRLNIKAKNIYGKTAMDIAVANDAKDVIPLLEFAGLPISTQTPSTSIHPRAHHDILHVYFLLTQAFLKLSSSTPPPATLKSLLITILNTAEYWVRTTVTRDEPKRVTMEDERNNDDFYPAYVASKPIEGSPITLSPVQRLVFTTRSADQGWSSYRQHWGTYSDSWSGFRARIRRANTSPSSSSLSESTRNLLLSSPTSYEADSEDVGQEEVREEEERIEEYHIQVNVHAGREPKWHTNIWLREGMYGNVVQSLRAGDVVEVVPYAKYPGWENRVWEVRVEVWMGVF